MDSYRIKRHSNLILCLILIVVMLAVFRQIKDHEFINLDDPVYVLDNPHVRSGLSPQGLLWALTSTYAANWHPISWISHMLDCDLYGLNPSGHHLNNLLFHIGGTLLLFLSLFRMTGARGRSLLVASLFALHPLHVESVAWISERKDVLSGLFCMATLWAYAHYVEKPSVIRYSLVFLLFLLGLMSKPMTVTLPFVLLLLDYWPLNRFGSWKRILLEKAPLFMLSAGSSAITFIAQEAGGAVSYQLSLSLRVANSLSSYVGYMSKMFFPYPLSVFYPHPLGALSLFDISGALFLLGSITLLSFHFSSKVPYLTVGWLWYLGTMVPVIGLVQIGCQGMADRYTYIPLIGLFLVLSWGTAQLTERFRRMKRAAILFWLSSIAILSILSASRVEKWRNNVELYQQAISVHPGNYIAHHNLAYEFSKKGRLREAETHFLEALKGRPGDPLILNNLGNVMIRQGRIEEGVFLYKEALRINPNFSQARFNLELALRMILKRNGHESDLEEQQSRRQ